MHSTSILEFIPIYNVLVEKNIQSKFGLHSVTVLSGEHYKDSCGRQSLSEVISNPKAVFRTAPATVGLLNTMTNYI